MVDQQFYDPHINWDSAWLASVTFAEVPRLELVGNMRKS